MADSPLKLLLVTHYYSTHRGGVEIVAGKLVKQLIRDYQISAVWVASNTDPCPADYPGIEYQPVSAINFFENNLQIPYPIWGFSAFLKLWKGVKEADIVHVHDYLYMGNIITFILAKNYRKPIIMTQHIGLIPYKNMFLRGLLSGLNKTIGRYILSSTEQVIFISNEVQRYFLNYTPFKNRPLMIANGVEKNDFCPVSLGERRRIREGFGFASDARLCLFVGRFVEKKGLPILQGLVKQLSNVHWIFAGWGPLDPEEWQLPNVTVFKELSGQALAPLYQMADLLVLPSKGEGFPLVVQEAMACGTPTMVSPEVAQAYPEAAPLMFSLPVEAADAESGDPAIAQWSSYIEHLYSGTLLSELRSQVAAFAAEHWSWEQCAQQYQSIFETCLSKTTTGQDKF